MSDAKSVFEEDPCGTEENSSNSERSLSASTKQRKRAKNKSLTGYETNHGKHILPSNH